MRRILPFVFIFLVACSNIDKKEHYYNNSVRINAIFNKTLESFEKAYVRVSLYTGNKELLEERYVYDFNHKNGNTNNKKLLINFKNYSTEYLIELELFADINYDGIYEKYKAVLTESKGSKEFEYEFK